MSFAAKGSAAGCGWAVVITRDGDYGRIAVNIDAAGWVRPVGQTTRVLGWAQRFSVFETRNYAAIVRAASDAFIRALREPPPDDEARLNRFHASGCGYMEALVEVIRTLLSAEALDAVEAVAANLR